MPIGGVYDTGTVAVTNGSATVVGTGVFWPDVLEGDHLIIAGLVSLVASVNTGTSTITLLKPYLGASNAAAAYQLVKMSWLRYDPSTVMYQTRDMLSRIKDSNTGLFYYTVGTPDPSIGENGDLAIDVTTSLWKFWLKASGIWVLQSPIFAEGIPQPTTGDLKPTHKIEPDPTWIMWRDGTIGDAASIASIRANADTQPLFALYYLYADADCPLLTSLGAATTRAAQGTAVAAFAAHCRLTLPRGNGRKMTLAGVGAGLTARNALGSSSIGAETETPTIGKTAHHQHPYDWLVTNSGGQAGAGIGGWSSLATGNTGNVNSGGTTNLNILNPETVINVMIKL
jgi:hypothetical protein